MLIVCITPSVGFWSSQRGHLCWVSSSFPEEEDSARFSAGRTARLTTTRSTRRSWSAGDVPHGSFRGLHCGIGADGVARIDVGGEMQNLQGEDRDAAEACSGREGLSETWTEPSAVALRSRSMLLRRSLVFSRSRVRLAWDKLLARAAAVGACVFLGSGQGVQGEPATGLQLSEPRPLQEKMRGAGR